MLDEPIALKVLLRERHWSYNAFCVEYDKAAKEIDPRLIRTWPSRAQFHRWLAGDLLTLPHPDACRVLEDLFPGWTVKELFARYGEPRSDQLPLTTASGDDDETGVDSGELPAGGFQDVTGVYTTRSEFTAAVPPHTLFANAVSIRASGISLNLICQQYSERELIQMVERGGSLRCLFLDPDGTAIRQRELEENHPPGLLSELTRINIRCLDDRVRSQLAEDARSRLEIAIYDETIRFNIILVDDRLGIVQPYLPATRGIESPTFVLQRKWHDRGLLPVFDAVVSTLWTRARLV
jgi:Domain of unknown function (DUF5919)